jgi:hypothetical protein
MEVMIMRTCRPLLSKSEDTLGGPDWASLEMQLGAAIEHVRRFTWKP